MTYGNSYTVLSFICHIKNICITIKTIIQVKINSKEFKRIMEIYIPNRGLISWIYKRLKKARTVKTKKKSYFLKHDLSLWKQTSQTNSQTKTTNKDLKQCSTLLSSGKMQIKIVRRFHFNPVRTFNTKKTLGNKCWQRLWERTSLSWQNWKPILPKSV